MKNSAAYYMKCILGFVALAMLSAATGCQAALDAERYLDSLG